MDNIKKEDGKLYHEIDIKILQDKLVNLEQQKTSINYTALEEEYDNNVKALKDWEKSLDKQIEKLNELLK